MTLEEKIETIRRVLSKRSKESIINDICGSIGSNDVENIAWMFDIYID